MALSVIGAGFGRTGTESMKQALELLGYGPCYHMLEVLPNKARVLSWRAIARGKQPDWDDVFQGFAATVDWPGAFFWRELSDFYPDAKILLTVRDSASWYESMENTILPVLRNTTDHNSIGTKLVLERVFAGNIDDRDHVIEAYERNTADVQAAFTPDRLLTYHVGDGWARLCRFLECSVPDVPYPHTNRPDQFQEAIARADRRRENG
jgi:hypothetical protein